MRWLLPAGALALALLLIPALPLLDSSPRQIVAEENEQTPRMQSGAFAPVDLVTDGTFDSPSSWTTSSDGDSLAAVSGGEARLTHLRPLQITSLEIWASNSDFSPAAGSPDNNTQISNLDDVSGWNFDTSGLTQYTLTQVDIVYVFRIEDPLFDDEVRASFTYGSGPTSVQAKVWSAQDNQPEHLANFYSFITSPGLTWTDISSLNVTIDYVQAPAPDTYMEVDALGIRVHYLTPDSDSEFPQLSQTISAPSAYGVVVDDTIYNDGTHNGTSSSTGSDLITISGSGSADYVSPLIDAGGTRSWHSMTWDEILPSGSTIAISTRGGNSTVINNTWSSWTPVLSGSPGLSHDARFMQFQILFTESGTPPAVQNLTIRFTQVMLQMDVEAVLYTNLTAANITVMLGGNTVASQMFTNTTALIRLTSDITDIMITQTNPLLILQGQFDFNTPYPSEALLTVDDALTTGAYALTVDQPPSLTSPCPSFSRAEDDDAWFVNLPSFFVDDQTLSDQLVYLISNVSTNFLDVTLIGGTLLRIGLVPDQSGHNDIHVTATDSGSLSTSCDITVEVAEVNDPPVFVNAPSTLFFAKGQTDWAELQILDPDDPVCSGSSVTSSFYLTLVAGNCTIQADYPANFESASETVTVTLRDARGEESTTTIVVQLADPPDIWLEVNVSWETQPDDPDTQTSIDLIATVGTSSVLPITFVVELRLDDALLQTFVAEDLSDGSVQFTFTWVAQGGEHSLAFIADPNDDIPESDEVNNFWSMDFDVTEDEEATGISGGFVTVVASIFVVIAVLLAVAVGGYWLTMRRRFA